MLSENIRQKDRDLQKERQIIIDKKTQIASLETQIVNLGSQISTHEGRN